jgi:hypothetical protein
LALAAAFQIRPDSISAERLVKTPFSGRTRAARSKAPMQCPNCRFENMPGSQACARCGSALNLSTAVLDVHPSRASKISKRLRTLQVRKTAHTIVRGAATARSAIATAIDNSAPGSGEEYIVRSGSAPPMGYFLRLVGPGWPQYFTRRYNRGLFFLVLYLLILAVSAFFFGYRLGSIFLGVAFVVHIASVWDAMYSYSRTYFAIMMITLALAWYVPIGVILMHICEPVVIRHPLGMFQPDDVVLVHRWFHRGDWIQPGVIVEYHTDPFDNGDVGVVRGDDEIFFEYHDGNIDRVLALGGQTVSWDGKQLFVDGQPSPWKPLVDISARGELPPTQIPDDSVLILPSGIDWGMKPPDWDQMFNVILVKRSEIMGTVWWRWQPHSRFGPIR